MKSKRKSVLGLDTSNYTTSLAVVDIENNIRIDERVYLNVKKGERGLRQSHALFQHMENLPAMIEKTFQLVDPAEIEAIAVSDRPRPYEDSYMPVFLGGVDFGRVLAATLKVNFLTFSHQEGHLASASLGTGLDENRKYLAFQLSGGTCELLLAEEGRTEQIGTSKDLSFGQVIDRLGVAMNLAFPCGKELDELAQQYTGGENKLKEVFFDGLDINLSGMETQSLRLHESGKASPPQLAYSAFSTISDAIIKWSELATKNSNTNQILFAGGVAESEFIRKRLMAHYLGSSVTVFFAGESLSKDNAIGIALLGGRKLWR